MVEVKTPSGSLLNQDVAAYRLKPLSWAAITVLAGGSIAAMAFQATLVLAGHSRVLLSWLASASRSASR